MVRRPASGAKIRTAVADVPNVPYRTGRLLFNQVTGDGGARGSAAGCAMRRILVPVDGSELADRALEHSAGLACSMADTRLHVVSVLPPVRVYGEVEVYAGQEHMHELAVEKADHETVRSSIVYIHQCSDISKIKYPASIIDREINAAMAHGCAKIVVPVCAVQTVAFIKVHYKRNIRQVITRSGHICITIFYINIILPGYCGVLPGAGGNHK